MNNEASDEMILGRLRAQRLSLLRGDWGSVEHSAAFAVKYESPNASAYATDFWEEAQEINDRSEYAYKELLEKLEQAIALQKLCSALQEFETDLAHVDNEQLGAYIRHSLLEWAHMGFDGAEFDGYGDSMAAVLRDITAGLKTYSAEELTTLAEQERG